MYLMKMNGYILNLSEQIKCITAGFSFALCLSPKEIERKKEFVRLFSTPAHLVFWPYNKRNGWLEQQIFKVMD